MILPFELPKDKDWRDDALKQPYQIVSLWTMLRTKADQFVKNTQIIAYNDGILDCMRREPGKTQTVRPPIRESIRSLRDQTESMGLKETALRCGDALKLLLRNVEISALSAALTNIRYSFEYELKKEVFLQLRPEHGSLYTGRRQFLSRKVLKDMPELNKEVARARRCFALEEYTAAAFHLIRITEYLLQGFLKKLALTPNPEQDTWGSVLKQTKDCIWNWDKKHPHCKYKKPYQACWNRLNGVCPSRNDLIHHNQNYSEKDAIDLKGTIQLCIQSYLALPDLPESP
jgi:hypothetical protein